MHFFICITDRMVKVIENNLINSLFRKPTIPYCTEGWGFIFVLVA